MSKKIERFLRCLTGLIVCASPMICAHSQTLCTDDESTRQPVTCNGISVGEPKVFDNRSLTLKLEALSKQLSDQQRANGVFSLKSIAAALNNIQGLSQSETDTSVSVLGNPTPGKTVTSGLNTGNVDAAGNPVPNTTSLSTQTTQASVTPTAPTFDSFGSLPSGFNPTFGNSASDLLNDQANLGYQIANLQTLLERALSDRLVAEGTTSCDGKEDCSHTRLQTVLGFNVSLDPPRTANDAVAVVEITVRCKDGGCPGWNSEAKDVSLVALMPQEKTYNSAALSSKSNAYSGAAVAGAFQVSAGLRHRSQTFYVYKDTDTLSYQRMTSNGELVFGWMFRPVLGRRSISPGLRQLFAVLALPGVDCDRPRAEAGKCTAHLDTSVRTYWKKYDRGTQTSFESQDANRGQKFWYGLSLGLAKPEILVHPRYVNFKEYSDVAVHSSDEYEAALTPVVRQVAWHATGQNNVLVSVRGDNFFSGTLVALGDQTYSEAANNLRIQSNDALDLTTTLDQLAAGPGSILGRYGLSTPLVQAGKPTCAAECPERGIEITQVDVGSALSGSRRIQIFLKPRLDAEKLAELNADVKAKESAFGGAGKAEQDADRNQTVSPQSVADAKSSLQKAKEDLDKAKDKLAQYKVLSPSRLPVFATRSLTAPDSGSDSWGGSPILSVNGTALKMPYEILKRPNAVVLAADLPDSLLSDGGGVVRVSWPFYDPNFWTSSLSFSNSDAQFKVARVSEKSIVISRVGNLAFVQDLAQGMISPEDAKDHCWQLIAGDRPVSLPTAACAYKPPPATAPKPVKGKKGGSPAPPAPEPLIQGQGYTVSATVDDLPSEAILLAPNGTIYHLTIPDLPKKKDAKEEAAPVALGQNDSTWLKVAIPDGKVPARVEANGGVLTWHREPASAKPKPGGKTSVTIEVEVTRALTAKPGTVALTVFDAKGNKIVQQPVKISCTQCSDKGDK